MTLSLLGHVRVYEGGGEVTGTVVVSGGEMGRDGVVVSVELGVG